MSPPAVKQTAFSSDYRTARERFVAAARALGLRLETYPLAGVLGPDGAALSIDVALHEAANSENGQRCLLISSGLHGVEAFLGSALQLALLQSWQSAGVALPNARIVLINALNPYGFAWLRRTDRDNIDLNRNFLLEGQAYAGAPPGYAALDALLNPARPPSAWDGFALRALAKIARHGMSALRNAIVAGQYDFPRGLFFGGHGESHTKRVIAANLAHWLGPARKVVHLDIHSGLGAWGSYKLLIDYALTEAQRARMRAAFGADAFEESGTRSVGYETRGGFGQWCVENQPARDYLFAYAEFGAYNLLRTLAGLRAENQAHFWGEAREPRTAHAKARLKELLCPAAPAWREQVLARGIDLVQRAYALLERT